MPDARPLLIAALWLATLAPATGQVQVDVNRPRSPYECDTPIGERWYGSERRCLEELCGGFNVTNEWLFDDNHRRRRNPCYGRNPLDFTGD